jgi:hypothetical protein
MHSKLLVLVKAFLLLGLLSICHVESSPLRNVYEKQNAATSEIAAAVMKTMALGPGTIDNDTGIFTPDPPEDPTHEDNSTRGTLITSYTGPLRLIHNFFDGSADCSTSTGVVRTSMQYQTGFICYHIYGEGYTVPLYYRAFCRGSTTGSTTDYDETVSLQFFEDADCTVPKSEQTTYNQRSCLPGEEFPNQSQVFYCEPGEAECFLCLHGAGAQTLVGVAVVAVAAVAVWAGM